MSGGSALDIFMEMEAVLFSVYAMLDELLEHIDGEELLFLCSMPKTAEEWKMDANKLARYRKRDDLR